MYYVYILTNHNGKVMYVGVTNDLVRRLNEHKRELIRGFTKRYHIHKLVFYTSYEHPSDAIACEKRIKGWRREKKNALVSQANPEWRDLSEDW